MLQGTVQNECTTIKATVDPTSNTLATFTCRLEAFHQLYIPEPAAVETQKKLPKAGEKKRQTHCPTISRQAQAHQHAYTSISQGDSTG